jgi:hypothetical protein
MIHFPKIQPFHKPNAMITKTIEPIITSTNTGSAVVGTTIEYRFLGILFYKKILHTPAKYGIKEYDLFQISI